MDKKVGSTGAVTVTRTTPSVTMSYDCDRSRGLSGPSTDTTTVLRFDDITEDLTAPNAPRMMALSWALLTVDYFATWMVMDDV